MSLAMLAALVGFIGIAGIVASILWLTVLAVRKRPKRRAAFFLVASMVGFFGGVTGSNVLRTPQEREEFARRRAERDAHAQAEPVKPPTPPPEAPTATRPPEPPISGQDFCDRVDTLQRAAGGRGMNVASCGGSDPWHDQATARCAMRVNNIAEYRSACLPK